MPTIRYRARRRAPGVSRLDPWQEFVLCHATRRRLEDLFGPEWESSAEAAWEAHGERLTAGWIADHPGSRPPLWWALDAPDERPIVNPAPALIEASWRGSYTLFGVLITGILHGHGRPSGHLVPWQEPEALYLGRHGLLTDAETLAASMPPCPTTGLPLAPRILE